MHLRLAKLPTSTALTIRKSDPIPPTREKIQRPRFNLSPVDSPDRKYLIVWRQGDRLGFYRFKFTGHEASKFGKFAESPRQFDFMFDNERSSYSVRYTMPVDLAVKHFGVERKNLIKLGEGELRGFLHALANLVRAESAICNADCEMSNATRTSTHQNFGHRQSVTQKRKRVQR